jgi:tetratricopeptide (TPR) repeat protein
MALRLAPVFLCAVLTVAAASAEDDADRLLASDRPEDLMRAAERFEARLVAGPETAAARVGAATALNRVMAIRTNANLPLFDGLQDGEAERALWSELAPRALDHARRGRALAPGSAEAAAALANAYMFHASSLGIVRSILAGASSEYRQNAQALVELDPRYDDALGDYLLASFYRVAPWPVGDADEALRHYRRAADLQPASLRNQYGLAVHWAREGELPRARGHYERVLEGPCTDGSERLFCGWLKAESQRALRALAAH